MQEPEATPTEEVEDVETDKEPLETDEETPAEEGGEPEELTAEEYQAKLDEAEEKTRKAEARAGFFERQAKRQAKDESKEETVTEPETKPRPRREQFTDDDGYLDEDAYNDAVSDWRYERREAVRKRTDARETAKKERQDREIAFQEKLSEGFKKYDDFQEVALSNNLPISDAMVEALYDCDRAADVAYYLGKNVDEARRIYQLSAIAAAREIGKLEAKIISGPPQKSRTNAPGATSPSGGKDVIPKKLEDMSTDEYIRYKNKQEGLPVD